MNDERVLDVRNLSIDLISKRGVVNAIKDINFEVKSGKTLGIIGESGSGKSLTCSAILGLLDSEQWIVNGDISLKDEGMPYRNNKEMIKYRGKRIALITQNPMSSFDPLMSIKKHFIETLIGCKNITKIDIEEKAIELLEKMHIKNAKYVLDSYPFQLSGGMLQRVMIAIAISLEPDILIADEPTTALDLTIQFEIVKILKEMQEKLGTTILIVSHDLGVISELADDVVVMYAGDIVEKGPINYILENPSHPYTKGLFSSRPAFSKERLNVLEGHPPNLFQRNRGCQFYDRCSEKGHSCKSNDIYVSKINNFHEVRCIRFKKEESSSGTA
ncbi:MAG: ABC transporter ATP-binding protein [Terrisporobacter sp.]